MRARGFSLLEILVAITLIGLGFTVVFAGMSGSMRGLSRVEATEDRVARAREKLAEVDLIKRIRPGETVAGQFEDGTRWTLQTSPFIAPVDDGMKHDPASIIEIDLTMEWMGRAETQKQVIRTYRYQAGDNMPIPPLEQQLNALK